MKDEQALELQQLLEKTQNELTNNKRELNEANKTIKKLEEQVAELSETNNSVDNEMIQQIIDRQDKIIEYFIPDEEELEKQNLELEKQEKEKQKLLAEEEKENQARIQTEEEYKQELLTQIKLVNENVGGVKYETSNTNVYMYLVCLSILFLTVCIFIYKMLKKFTHY